MDSISAGRVSGHLLKLARRASLRIFTSGYTKGSYCFPVSLSSRGARRDISSRKRLNLPLNQ